jgi:hypothetical protein
VRDVSTMLAGVAKLKDLNFGVVQEVIFQKMQA